MRMTAMSRLLHQVARIMSWTRALRRPKWLIPPRSASRSSARISKSAVMGVKDSEDLHRYTRSRFVSNEATEMAQRYAHFDIKHLVDVAAQAVGSASCAKAEKLAEGAYNKALLLTMDDGKQVVARVPNPNAGQAYLTTASEVATMKYVSRSQSLPVHITDFYPGSRRLASSSAEDLYV